MMLRAQKIGEAQPQRPRLGGRVAEADRDRRRPSSTRSVRPSASSSAPTTANSAVPPIQVWMPNQPQATKARIRAGRLAP